MQTPLPQQFSMYCTQISNTVQSPSPPISNRIWQTRKDTEREANPINNSFLECCEALCKPAAPPFPRWNVRMLCPLSATIGPSVRFCAALWALCCFQRATALGGHWGPPTLLPQCCYYQISGAQAEDEEGAGAQAQERRWRTVPVLKGEQDGRGEQSSGKRPSAHLNLLLPWEHLSDHCHSLNSQNSHIWPHVATTVAHRCHNLPHCLLFQAL